MDNLNKRVLSLEIKNKNSDLIRKLEKGIIKKIITVIFLYCGTLLTLFLYSKFNFFIVSIVPCVLYLVYELVVKIILKNQIKRSRSGDKK